MSDLLQVATRKGLFEIARKNGGWDIVASHFLGDPISAVLTIDGMNLAAPDLGHFGPKLWRRDGKGTWAEMAMPTFPEKPADAEDDPHPWTLGRIWNFTPGPCRAHLRRDHAGRPVPVRRHGRNLVPGRRPVVASGSQEMVRRRRG
ncbi:MAG: hypothetical protein ABJI82_07725 [Alphaproteobacteria bacterium]